MQGNLSDVEQRIKRYWYTDGIAELTGGGILILLGLYFALQEFLGQNSIVSVILQSSLVLLMVGGAFVSRRLVNALKARLTYPRTGYVEYQVDEGNMRRKQIGVVILAMMVSALSMLFVRLFQSLNAMVAVTGLIVGLILVILRARSSGLPRFYVLGVVSVVLGLVLSVSGLPDGYSLGLFYGLMGVSFLLSGGLTLQRYLKENPLPADAERQNG